MVAVPLVRISGGWGALNSKKTKKTGTHTVTDTNKDTLVPSFCHVDIFSWEPALETPNSQAAEADVKKKHCNFRQ